MPCSFAPASYLRDLYGRGGGSGRRGGPRQNQGSSRHGHETTLGYLVLLWIFYRYGNNYTLSFIVVSHLLAKK